jgi:hypothetical protein
MSEKKYIQIILDPEKPEEKTAMDFIDKRYPHIGGKALFMELIEIAKINEEVKRNSK